MKVVQNYTVVRTSILRSTHHGNPLLFSCLLWRIYPITKAANHYHRSMADSPDDDRMDDDLEESDPAAAAVDLDELRNLLEELASTRPDVQTPSCRNARIQLATETLSKAKAGRQLLARMGQGACAS
jgi:hypothetical protein